MPLTTIDPATALIVIDLQNGLLALPAVHPIPEVVEKAGSLAREFRRHRLPVVLVNVTGAAPGRTQQPPRAGFSPDAWELAAGLDRQQEDYLVSKQTWGAFIHTGLEAYLKSRGVTQVVLAGVATSIGVESTARQAFELGFNVTLAVDAMTDLNADSHQHSVTRIFPRLGETGTVAEIIGLLNATHR